MKTLETAALLAACITALVLSGCMAVPVLVPALAPIASVGVGSAASSRNKTDSGAGTYVSKKKITSLDFVNIVVRKVARDAGYEIQGTMANPEMTTATLMKTNYGNPLSAMMGKVYHINVRLTLLTDGKTILIEPQVGGANAEEAGTVDDAINTISASLEKQLGDLPADTAVPPPSPPQEAAPAPAKKQTAKKKPVAVVAN